MEKLTVKCTFIESVLGSSPNNQNIYRDFIASKSPDAINVEDELAAVGVEAYTEKHITIFPRDAQDRPFIYDYQIKGFFKDACQMLSRLSKREEITTEDGKVKKQKTAANESGKLKAYKKEIDGLIFVEPRQILIESGDADVGLNERPLRAQTAQGERTALAISEELPAGSTFTFTVQLFNPEHRAAVLEWLDYGFYRGLGQWRNSGHGRFTYQIVADA